MHISPSSEDLAHGKKLTTWIIQHIQTAGGAMPFVDFMHAALYTPNLGYYDTLAPKIGNPGDFITAPEISPLFSRCLAQQCQQVLSSIGNEAVIIEVGAGTGRLAAEILTTLATLNTLPQHYFILEISAGLRHHQQLYLQNNLPLPLLQKIVWLSTLPSQPLKGIILANEVLDAMPVHRFCRHQSTWLETHVGYQNDQFNWQYYPTTNPQLQEFFNQLPAELPEGYQSEVNLWLTGWLQTWAEHLTEGLLLILDYGFPTQEYYHPQRSEGTLMCHYQHQAHTNPLQWVGLQDITAHVDFGALAQAGQATGWEIMGYTQQAHFLVNCGLLDLLAHCAPVSSVDYLRAAQQVKKLLLPNEMGELFKVMGLARNWTVENCLGFTSTPRQ